MKKLLQIILLLAGLAWCVPARATMAKVQIVALSTCSGTPTVCSGTVSAIGTTKHFGVVMAGCDGCGAHVISSVTGGGGTWTVPAGCKGLQATINDQVSCSYNLLFDTASTTVSATFDANIAGGQAIFIEYSFDQVSVSLDGTPCFRDGSTSSTSQAGCAITLTGTKDVVVQGIWGGAASTAIGSSYTNRTTYGASSKASIADLENTTSGLAPTWTIASAGRAALNGIAISETQTGAAAHTMPPAVY